MNKKLIEIEKQVVLVGHGGSGKTCILHRVFSKKFEEKYTPTVFEDTKHTRIIKNQQITLLILDTAGQDDYGRMIEINLNDADLVIFCYAVDCRNSFETLFSDYFSLLGDKTNKLIFLVGCKTDTREFKQVISYEEGKALAKKMGAAYFCETSAKNNVGCNELFDEIFKFFEVKELKQIKKEKKRSFFDKLFGCCGCGNK